MTSRNTDFIAVWEDAVARQDLVALSALFAPGATFRSPAVFRPYQGREAILGILGMVMQVFGPLTYTHAYRNDGGGVVMQFETSVAGPDKELQLEGVDIFQLDADGLIREMTVMLRPLRGLQAVAAAMEARLAAR